MTSPKNRSRSVKKRQVRTPGGRTVTHYKKKKPSKHSCGRCGKILPGVPSRIRSKAKNMKKSEKIPSRIYAGNLCNECVDSLVRYQTRFEAKFKYPDFSDLEMRRDLTLERFLPSGWWQDLSKGK
ncbi:MAG: 50S ribosomal protein L34e [Candidatus Altiarchaeota archaeon]|nr:50S ribosomal protein L34e [Candidatus Altiarchaeota archaeon]MBU4265739.1 50S ribosomal protein L34e [Candidatus Altiarchaeota archaeon]MBU4341519.1 50S ribosomal protein L34e [Candidatus Altiarchaeota archaeon]MBU4406231.1 50S ribosomal protein L34e [Candidatus Altiarchaeota archaeon]MBU4436654.1 50S ribosomal protein L34e [Candidatus Altiarchaeota archaeon]